jgi:hypothetical protein
MKTTANKIAKFIKENVSLQANSTVSIYESSNGLSYTRGSMEFRDENHKLVLVFNTMDEVPSTFAALKRSVEFQLKRAN